MTTPEHGKVFPEVTRGLLLPRTAIFMPPLKCVGALFFGLTNLRVTHHLVLALGEKVRGRALGGSEHCTKIMRYGAIG